MPLIDAQSELVQIDLPTPGEWVKVKRRLSLDDRDHIRSASVRGQTITTVGPDRHVEASVETILRAMERAKAEVAVVQWSFDVPVTPESLGMLDEDSWFYLRDKLDEMYPGERTEAEKNDYSGSGPNGDSDGPSSLPQISDG